MNFMYQEEDRMMVSFYTLIVRTKSLKEKICNVHDFLVKNKLCGVTNGKLLLIPSMTMPSDDLDEIIKKYLIPGGLKHKEDFVLVYEEYQNWNWIRLQEAVTTSFKFHICGLREIDWLDGEITSIGYYVWAK